MSHKIKCEYDINKFLLSICYFNSVVSSRFYKILNLSIRIFFSLAVHEPLRGSSTLEFHEKPARLWHVHSCAFPRPFGTAGEHSWGRNVKRTGCRRENAWPLLENETLDHVRGGHSPAAHNARIVPSVFVCSRYTQKLSVYFLAMILCSSVSAVRDDI